MQSYDLLENISTWTEIYKEASDADKAAEQWQKGMLKVVSVFSNIEDFEMTPFKHKLDIAISYARTGDVEKLGEIYALLSEIEKFIMENAAV
jgi:hypothetical protein